MEILYLDTHAVVWLYAGLIEKFPAATRERIEQSMLAISPAVYLELQYLYEIQRISEPASTVFADLAERIELTMPNYGFGSIALHAALLHWTRDPFDRLIAAETAITNSWLLTQDRKILDHFHRAIW